MSLDTNYGAGIKLMFKSEWSSFFACFARFEYALKRAGYLKYDKTGTSAEAGWDSFAKDLGEAFYQSCRSIPELNVLFASPPRLLKVDKDQTVSWKTGRTVNNAVSFFQAVKDVRNNLFHGEKQVHAERDDQLIAAAQLALDMAWQVALKSTAPRMAEFRAHFHFVI